jgi:uncharacterized membrane protein (DUF373 family)
MPSEGVVRASPDRTPGEKVPERPGLSLLGGLIGFELLLYVAVGILLAVAAGFVFVGTVHELVHAISARKGGVDTGVIVLDRVLLLLIIAELVYTLRFVLRTHEIAVEPFLFIGLIAVVRRILIVTAQFERLPSAGRALTNLLLELGLLGFLALALAASLFLIRRGREVRASLPNRAQAQAGQEA